MNNSNQPLAFDIMGIQDCQRNRYPLLFLDQIINVIPGESAKGIKCFTFNDTIWLKLKNHYRLIKDSQNIPYDILKTLPVLSYKNKMIIPFLTDKKKMRSFGISVIFKPQIPLTKKNF